MLSLLLLLNFKKFFKLCFLSYQAMVCHGVECVVKSLDHHYHCIFNHHHYHSKFVQLFASFCFWHNCCFFCFIFALWRSKQDVWIKENNFVWIVFIVYSVDCFFYAHLWHSTQHVFKMIFILKKSYVRVFKVGQRITVLPWYNVPQYSVFLAIKCIFANSRFCPSLSL